MAAKTVQFTGALVSKLVRWICNGFLGPGWHLHWPPLPACFMPTWRYGICVPSEEHLTLGRGYAGPGLGQGGGGKMLGGLAFGAVQMQDGPCQGGLLVLFTLGTFLTSA